MATSGTLFSAVKKTSKFYVKWNVTNNSISGNYSNVHWEAGLYIDGSDKWYNNAIRINSIYINNSLVQNSISASNFTTSGYHQMASGDITIYHNNDGKKSFDISISGWLYSFGETSGKDTYTLDTIPRYLSSYSISSGGSTLESISINWNCSPSCNTVQYSLDNGSWTNVSGNGTSGSFTISNLYANTEYNVKVKLKRADSELWSTTNTIYITTKNNATIKTPRK